MGSIYIGYILNFGLHGVHLSRIHVKLRSTWGPSQRLNLELRSEFWSTWNPSKSDGLGASVCAGSICKPVENNYVIVFLFLSFPTIWHSRKIASARNKA